MLNRQDMKNFVEQILIKFESFYVIKVNLVQTVLSTIRRNIGESINGNSYIVRYSKG